MLKPEETEENGRDKLRTQNKASSSHVREKREVSYSLSSSFGNCWGRVPKNQHRFFLC